MRITKSRVIILIFVVVISILIAKFLSSIAVNYDDRNFISYNGVPHIDHTLEHLMWFAQVSDLHLSLFQDKERSTELLELCDYTLGIVKPFIVLATGDLTDAKTPDFIGSAQLEEEWIKYKNVIDKCRTIKKTPWLDIRGNHDNFDVPSISSPKNYFRNYSMQGKRHSRSYLHRLSVGSDTYAFIGVDACPAVGLKRPFNFIGILPETEIAELKRLSSLASNANYTIWFGHYPTSCMMSHLPGVRSVIASNDKSLAYLCGHFHSMLGLVPNMYSLQKNGFLELELADWKDNRMFRIVAIDHGLLSFVDVKHRDWPIILITNPKSAVIQSPWREPLGSMLSSTHIRLLIFSPSEILTVLVRIDDGNWESAKHAEGPLFVLPWEPYKYAVGLHDIHVRVNDKDGREKREIHYFSLDGSTLQLGVLSRILLMLNFSEVMQVFFGLAVISSVFPYCVLRHQNGSAKRSKRYLPTLKNNVVHRWLRRIWIFSNIDTLFYPIVLYPLYISIGPWAIAEVLNGKYGVIFIWGIFVNGTYIPAPLTYGYAFIQLFTLQAPLVAFTSYAVDKRLLESFSPSQSSSLMKNSLSFCLGSIPYLLLLTSQILMAWAFYSAYGPLAVFGPIRLWPIFMILWVWYQISHMPLSSIKAATSVWDNPMTCQHSSD